MRLFVSRSNSFAIWFVSVVSLCHSAASQTMQPGHVAKLRYALHPEIAPSGKWIAYNLVVPRQPLEEEDGPAWTELHVSDLEKNSRPFVIGQVSIGNVKWSHDSQWIYYTAKRGDDKETCLYRIAVDGGESIRVLQSESSIQGFDLSPAGGRIAFLAKEKTDSGKSELDKQGFDQEIYEEDLRATHVWIASIDDANRHVDAPVEARKLELPGSASEVSWSPDGEHLMVVLAPTPLIDDSYMFKRVSIVDAETGEIVRKVRNPGKLGDVVWSPDGKHLAVISGVDINDPKEGRLMLAPVTGNEPLKDLLPDLDAHVHTVAWKDETTLIWLAADGVSSRMGTVTTTGARRDLPGSEIVFTEFSYSASSDAMALLGSSPKHPSEVYSIADVAKPSTRRMTNLNPWLDELQFAKQELVQWQARDGTELQGILIYPLNHVEGAPYPLIMYVHGGPESHESNGWITSYSKPGQVAAARGFAVFYPNYRGSTGRGVDFSKMGQADAAGKEFDDLVDGVDHLIEKGLVLKDAVGVTGGSYGGYASAWCATYYSDRFAASVMFVGISDNVSKVGTTDIPEEMYYVHHGKRLWDDWPYFLERSPIRYVQRNQTPTLIMHGKNDPRVHPSQSLELHRHLKTLGQAPVRLVLYEGEGHGNRKAAARLDYNLRMLRWMEHFLKANHEDAPDTTIDYRKELGLESDASEE